MNTRRKISVAAHAKILAIFAWAAILFSACEKSYEMPPLTPDTETGATPGPSDSQDKPDNPDAPGDPSDESRPRTQPSGSGTEDDPYNVAAVLAITDDQAEIWVEGWIVGFVKGAEFPAGALYRAPLPEDGFKGGNLILSDLQLPAADSSVDTLTAAEREILAEESLPVALWGPWERNYGLSAHPEYMTKRAKIKCATGRYLASRALVDLSAFLLPDAPAEE